MITISKMNLDDLNQIKNILFSDFDDFWNYSIFKSELENSNSYYLTAKDKSKIVGFAGIKVSIPDADIMNIVVRKNYRKHGIGSFLMRELINFASSLGVRNLFLEVNEKNSSAISLYQKFNFKEISIRKNYYNENNAIIMKKEI